MEADEREKRVRRFVDEVWNRGNYDCAAELYGERYTNAFGSGPSARVEPIRRYRQSFPDLHLDVDEVIVADDAVVLRATFRGTDTGGDLGRARLDGAWRSGWSLQCASMTTRWFGSGSEPTSSASSFSSGSSTIRGPPRHQFRGNCS